MVYGKKEIFGGPAVSACGQSKDEIRLSFTNVGRGLRTNGGKLRGFALLDESLTASEVDAEIVGSDTVVLRIDGRSYDSVGYAFSNQNGASNLYNSAGYAALPFRIPRSGNGERSE